MWNTNGTTEMVEETNRRSAIVQGGLEILVLVTLSVQLLENNQAKFLKLEALFNDCMATITSQ